MEGTGVNYEISKVAVLMFWAATPTTDPGGPECLGTWNKRWLNVKNRRIAVFYIVGLINERKIRYFITKLIN